MGIFFLGFDILGIIAIFKLWARPIPGIWWVALVINIWSFSFHNAAKENPTPFLAALSLLGKLACAALGIYSFFI